MERKSEHKQLAYGLIEMVTSLGSSDQCERCYRPLALSHIQVGQYVYIEEQYFSVNIKYDIAYFRRRMKSIEVHLFQGDKILEFWVPVVSQITLRGWVEDRM